MAITAKVDAFSVASGTATDVQPAAGEVWLIKSFPFYGIYAQGSMNIRVSLWDGTDDAPIWELYSAGTTDYMQAGGGIRDRGGNTGVNAFYANAAEYSVIVTNTMRMRFFRGGTSGVMGYSGVQLA